MTKIKAETLIARIAAEKDKLKQLDNEAWDTGGFGELNTQNVTGRLDGLRIAESIVLELALQTQKLEGHYNDLDELDG